MSSISYREWDIWVNKTRFDDLKPQQGIFLIKIEPLLMAQQTVQFVYESIDLIRKGEAKLTNQADAYFSVYHWTPQELVLQKLSTLSHQDDLPTRISGILHELDALSMCLDFPLTCHHIEFFIPPVQYPSGVILTATRRSISRAVSFEVDERGAAFQKVSKDFDFFLNAPRDIQIASRHYINGLTLLGLEDSYPGLIDAAYMQFYQACEILCGNNHELTKAQRHVAKLNLSDQETIQIALHHVWQVRNDYFGHGNAKNWLYASQSSDAVLTIAKQVLVARWLCRSLLDCESPSTLGLCRDILLYNENSAQRFNGTVQELETSFRVDYKQRTGHIKDSSGSNTRPYAIA